MNNKMHHAADKMKAMLLDVVQVYNSRSAHTDKRLDEFCDLCRYVSSWNLHKHPVSMMEVARERIRKAACKRVGGVEQLRGLLDSLHAFCLAYEQIPVAKHMWLRIVVKMFLGEIVQKVRELQQLGGHYASVRRDLRESLASSGSNLCTHDKKLAV
jgi:hypothetical protein